ncbi:hypothetical protein [Haloparvum sedimenti]|uniref:hypothetical protein n=1 Tax=Haloparvum sedimenti TaxID=1678448 RepID=UPI00071E84F6|nr:hypothetical protein [Haloparvum sedimenti]
MQNLNISARKRLSKVQRPYVEGFDTTLADVMHDYLPEDTQSRHLAAAFAEAEHALQEREDALEYDDVASGLDREVQGKLHWALEKRTRERVAELCVETIEDAAADVDDRDPEYEQKLREAAAEAREWLSMNTNPAERADVPYGPEELPDVEEVAVDA